MKERPILFSGPMVRAILDGRKTQTRRVVKPSPGLQSRWASVGLLAKCPSCYLCFVDGEMGAQFQHPHAGTTQHYGEVAKDSPMGWFRCPYGAPGDRLWVRETWQTSSAADSKSPRRMAIDSIGSTELIPLRYTAGGFRARFDTRDMLWGKSRPSIHMPRWASRINLEITGLRVERLREISEADAVAEGVDAVSMADFPRQATMSRRADFAQLWDSINGKPRKSSMSPKKRAATVAATEKTKPLYSWASNPWVWVIEFKALEPTP